MCCTVRWTSCYHVSDISHTFFLVEVLHKYIYVVLYLIFTKVILLCTFFAIKNSISIFLAYCTKVQISRMVTKTNIQWPLTTRGNMAANMADSVGKGSAQQDSTKTQQILLTGTYTPVNDPP